MDHYNRIVIERGKKKVFASALDWPGWSRDGKDDDGAIGNLVAYAERYRMIARLAGVQGVDDHRHAVVDAIRTMNAENAATRWPLRYYIRRAAWHLLDHAWEMEDKDLTREDTDS